MKAFYNDYEQLKEDIAACNKNFDLELIDRAYNLALDAWKPATNIGNSLYSASNIGCMYTC